MQIATKYPPLDMARLTGYCESVISCIGVLLQYRRTSTPTRTMVKAARANLEILAKIPNSDPDFKVKSISLLLSTQMRLDRAINYSKINPDALANINSIRSHILRWTKELLDTLSPEEISRFAENQIEEPDDYSEFEDSEEELELVSA